MKTEDDLGRCEHAWPHAGHNRPMLHIVTERRFMARAPWLPTAVAFPKRRGPSMAATGIGFAMTKRGPGPEWERNRSVSSRIVRDWRSHILQELIDPIPNVVKPADGGEMFALSRRNSDG